MKINLWCRIFGHKFVATTIKQEGYYEYRNTFPITWCRRCGLSKSELLLATGDARLWMRVVTQNFSIQEWKKKVPNFWKWLKDNGFKYDPKKDKNKK